MNRNLDLFGPNLSVVDLDAWRKDAATGTASTSVVLRKQFVSDIEVQDADRSVKFIITTGAADREKDVIDPAGWDVSSYLQNPVVLFAHDYDSLPIARTVSLEQHNDKLIAVAEFATAELNPMAEQVYQMLKQGFLKGASVGFRPLTFAYNDERGGVDFAQQELLEFSVVPIPANAQALMAAGVSSADVSLLTEWATKILRSTKQPDSDQLDDFLDVIRKQMNNIKVAVREAIKSVDDFQNQNSDHDENDDEDMASRESDPEIAKGVSPRNVSETTAPMDTPWRAPSLGDFVSEPWGDLTTRQRRNIAGHYAWATAAVPEKFGDMKLPHHRADDGHVIWRGVVAAAGRLNQTRFPAEDMGAVKQHLAGHFTEFDREAPWERDAISWDAFLKGRARLEAKSPDPLTDEQLAALFDDYGFADEAVALVQDRLTGFDLSTAISRKPHGYSRQLQNSPPREPSSLDRDVMDVLARVESRLTTIEGDDVVLELSDNDNDDDVVFDSTELAHAMRDALHDSVGAMVGAEMRSAINAARGRLD
jgi:HK97 family phage prohead protease